MTPKKGDIIYGEWIVRENADGSHTLYRDGWEKPYRTPGSLVRIPDSQWKAWPQQCLSEKVPR